MQDSDKTESPTPKRRADARKKGQVAKSADLLAAISFTVAILILYFYLAALWQGLTQHTINLWRHLLTDVTPASFYALMMQQLEFLALLLLPIFLALLVTGVAANVVQVGFHFSSEAVKPQLDRLNPINGFKRFFSMQPYQTLLINILKLAFFGYIGYSVVARHYEELVTSLRLDLTQTGALFGNLVWELCWKLALAMLILGLIDYAFHKYQFEKKLKMSRQEVKDEHKQMEGDPLIKSKQRSLRQQRARARMMQAVPKADVVITNPTHLAIAIRYNAQEMAAPKVVAKGANLVAEKIKEIAREHKVPIIENKPLARSLYQQVEVDQEIPNELYAAISEVLIYVYRLNGKLT